MNSFSLNRSIIFLIQVVFGDDVSNAHGETSKMMAVGEEEGMIQT